jgi:hypothetical protein
VAQAAPPDEQNHHVPLASRAALRHLVPSMFRLTRHERRILAFVLAAFLAGLGLKHWRQAQQTEAAVAEAQAR